MKTAWTDKHPAYDILNGPSGAGIDQLFTPEINLATADYTTNPASCMHYDTHHVNAIVNWWVQKSSCYVGRSMTSRPLCMAVLGS